MAAIVGVDVGTTGVKAVAVSPDGGLLGRVEEGYPVSMPQQGWSEQDPEAWWRATGSALERLGVSDMAGIGLSGQMHGLVVLDAGGEVLRPAILWNDQRTAAECAEIEGRIGLTRLIELTGNRALTGFTAPKLLWLRKNEPDVYERIHRVLLPKDYVRWKLTGEHAIDVADASGTLLFDVAHRRWSDEMVEELGINRDWLPRVLESPEESGRTAGGVAVAAGAGDQAAGALGVGVDRPGTTSLVLGTSGVLFAAMDSYLSDDLARLHVFCHAVPGAWHAMGVMLSAADSLRWLREGVLGGAPYKDILAEAEGWAPGSEGLTFLPYLVGERTPHADPDARAAFCGLSARHDRGALVRAVLEGVAYGLRDSLELLRALGLEVDRARVSGGGTKSDLWLRIIASVLDIPLEVAEVEEGAAYGAAMLGGIAGGIFGDVEEAVAACVRIQRTVAPVNEWRDDYASGYRTFRALYPALREVRSEVVPG